MTLSTVGQQKNFYLLYPFLRSCLNFILVLKYPNQRTIKWPVVWVWEFSATKIENSRNAKVSLKFDSHIFIFSNVPFEFSYFRFCIDSYNLCQVLILLWYLHSGSKIKPSYENIPGGTRAIDTSREFIHLSGARWWHFFHFIFYFLWFWYVTISLLWNYCFHNFYFSETRLWRNCVVSAFYKKTSTTFRRQLLGCHFNIASLTKRIKLQNLSPFSFTDTFEEHRTQKQC